jgi:AhpD family alkylhydroperoxidase
VLGDKKEGIMFIDTDEIRELREKYYLQMQKSGIKTFRDMDRIETEALEDGALSQKYKELIALGISIERACYGRIEYHVSSAVGLGTSRQEILEATAVAVALCGSVADWPARYVFKVLEDIGDEGMRE